MSTRAVSWAIHDFEVDNPQVKLILILLAENADENGKCWPSQKTTAKKAGCSESTVKRVQRTLARAGVIRVEGKRAGTHKTKNIYYLNLNSSFSLITRSKKIEEATVTPLKTVTATSTENKELQEVELIEGVTVTPLDLKVSQRPLQKTVGVTPDPFKGVTAMTPKPSLNRQYSISSINGPVEKFKMSPAWDPDSLIYTELSIELSINQRFSEGLLPAFRKYWQGEKQTETQKGWESKFIEQVRYKWERSSYNVESR